MKIIKLVADNFKALRAVEIVPDADDNIVEIRGPNGAGKSSVLDSILVALCGGRSIPDAPIRNGEKKAEITVDLGEIVVRRVFTPSGSKIFVQAADGNAEKEPQKLLDKLIGSVGFDPLEFSRKPSKDQALMLARVAGLDFEKLNAERKEAYDARTVSNREVKRLESVVEDIRRKIGSCRSADYKSEIDIASEMAALSSARSAHEAHKELLDSQKQKTEALGRDRDKLADLKKQVADLEASISQKEEELSFVSSAVFNSELSLPEIEPIESRISNASVHNDMVRNFQSLRSTLELLSAESDKSDSFSVAIERIDEEKVKSIASSNLPVEGISFDESGIYLNGVPFGQCCASEKIKLSVALAMALNSKIRVIRIADWSLLDSASKKTVRELADRYDCQVWAESVDDSPDGHGILIQDGEVQ